MAKILPAQQKVSFDQLSVPDGLSSNTVYEAIQDKYGFLWIGTEDGLNRYDGYKVDVFKHDPTDSLSMPANVVAGVFEDSKGILWIATTGGLSERDPDTGNFRTYTPSEAANQRERFMVQIYEDQQNRFWVGSRFRGLFLFDREQKIFERMQVEDDGSVSAPGGPVGAFLHTASGELFSGTTRDGLIRYNEQKKIFESINLKPHFPDNFIWDLHEDKSGNLWIASNNGLFKYQTAHGYVEKIELKLGKKDVKFIRALHEDQNGNLWIGSQTGLFSYNLRSGDIKEYTRANQPQHHLSNPAIWNIYEDNFGVMWITTIGGGLNKYDHTKITFDTYSDFTGEVNDADLSATYAIAPDAINRNFLWIGTNGGLWHMDRKKNKAEQISLPKDMATDRVGDLIQDGDDLLWIGTWNTGLLKYDLKNQTFKNYRKVMYQPTGMQGDRIIDLLQDDYGDLWIAGRRGLSHLDTKSGSISRVEGLENRMYNRKIHSYLDSLHKTQKPVAAILHVDDMADKHQEYDMKE